MKGLILSGGKGTRLWPYTQASAKQLIPIANRPILFYAIETLASAGVTDVGIVVGDCGAQIRDTVGEGARFGVAITYIEQDAPRGLAHAVQVAQPFLGADDFVLYLGDNIMRGGIAPIVERFTAERPDALIVLAHVAEPLCFGIAEFDGDRLVRLVEKPVATTSDLALVGVYLFTARVFDAIADITCSPRGELEITDAIQRMLDEQQRVAAHVLAVAGAGGAVWKDAGSLDGLLEANRLVLGDMSPRVDASLDESVRVQGPVVVERGASLHDCVVRGPAIIGAGATIADACIGPFTAIGAGCVVRRADVENSIVLEGTTVADVAGLVTSSLIGRRCVVQGGSGNGSGHGLLLCDDTKVELR